MAMVVGGWGWGGLNVKSESPRLCDPGFVSSLLSRSPVPPPSASLFLTLWFNSSYVR